MRWSALLICVGITPAAGAAEVPDFNRDVRPVLAAHCFKCHGPDDAARKAKLRLDSRDGAEHVLGAVASSELVRRITSSDEKEVMPPPAIKKPLSPKQQQTLRDWV